MTSMVSLFGLITTSLLSVMACRLSPIKEKVDSEKSVGLLNIIFNLNSKGYGVLALAVIDFISMGKIRNVGELIGVCLGTLIIFVVLFYIIYGIMSLMKVGGEDTIARREKAFWINFGINALLSVMMLMDA